MSNALDRMRANKNTRHEEDVNDLLNHRNEIASTSKNVSKNEREYISVIEINNKSKNTDKNTVDIESKDTSVNASENNYDNISDNEIKNENVNAYISANKKPKFEELHKKDTFWIRHEILEKLHGITKGNKGLKTQIINESLELFFKKNKI
jgi:hypothetical protein